MNEQDQQIALCEWTGWSYPCKHCYAHGYKTWRNPEDTGCSPIEDLPDTSSLDVLHEMEKRLIGEVGWVHYSQVLLGGNIHATAAQRREALLRTLGLWKE